VVEVPATIHKRKVGESKKGHNAIYGLKYAGVVLGTWLRERQRRVPGSGRAASSRGGTRPGERSAAVSDHADPFTRAPEPAAANGSEPLPSPAAATDGMPPAAD
jgi:hypothetical protein